MMKPSVIKHILTSLISNAASHADKFVNNPGKDMSRNRKCNFVDTVMLILGFENNSLKTEIARYFTNPKKRILKSSFVKQRAKINGYFFPWLFNSFNAAIPRPQKCKGYLLCCCDGSDLNLPPCKDDTENYVQYASKNGGYYQKHLNALFDPLNGCFLDAIIQPRPVFNEALALCEMVSRYDSLKPTVFLADRGYHSFNLMATIIEKGHFFLIRAKELLSSSSFLKHLPLPSEGEFDVDVTLGLTRSRRKKYTKHPDKYKILHTKRRFDYIDKDDYESVYELSFRVICVDIGGGNYEYLLTNLPRDDFSKTDLKDLYHIRWQIETAYRYIKYAFCMVYFHSRKRTFIDQEIYARLIMFNFASVLRSIGEKELSLQKGSSKRKWEQKLSFESIADAARQFLKTRMTDKTIKALLLTYKSPIRPGRTYHRNVKSQTAKSLNSRA